jgi:2-amino-4-hydroxy-6-hydroxymethyldihydropteridine diphosphokinase
MDQITIRDIITHPMIGLNPNEREATQTVLVTVSVERDTSRSLTTDDISVCCNYSTVYREVLDFTNGTKYLTIETLANNLAKHLLTTVPDLENVTITIKKVEALSKALYPELTIKRTASWAKSAASAASSAASSSALSFLALGSNMGDRLGNITRAIKEVGSRCKVVDTSNMYLSKDMYNSRNPYFYNCVICVDTDLSPTDLLSYVKEVECKLGRTSTTGMPRPIDIDIVLHGNHVISTPDLTIPHKDMLVRPFVLKPLLDIDPELRHPATGEMLSRADANADVDNGIDIKRIIPLQGDKYIDVSNIFVFSVLNATPDSFSGDGQRGHDAMPFVPLSASVIDIGGESTRPGHTKISSEEEIARVRPFFDKYKGSHIISIDTRKSNVAAHFIDHGAHIINDVSGLKFDFKMGELLKSRAVPAVLTHTSGTLETFYKTIKQLGLYRWNVVIDPGFGISKTLQKSVGMWQNISLDRSFTHMVSHSRKTHVATISDASDTDDRDVASLVLSTVAALNGVTGFRTHNGKYTNIMKNVLTSIRRGVDPVDPPAGPRLKSAYHVFCEMHATGAPGQIARLANIWKSLDNDAKETYLTRARSSNDSILDWNWPWMQLSMDDINQILEINSGY